MDEGKDSILSEETKHLVSVWKEFFGSWLLIYSIFQLNQYINKYWDSNAVYFKIKLDGQANGEIWAFQLHPLEWLWDMLYHGCCSHHLDGDVQCNQAIADSLWKAIQIIVSVRIIHGVGKLSDFVLFVTCFLSDALWFASYPCIKASDFSDQGVEQGARVPPFFFYGKSS